MHCEIDYLISFHRRRFKSFRVFVFDFSRVKNARRYPTRDNSSIIIIVTVVISAQPRIHRQSTFMNGMGWNTARWRRVRVMTFAVHVR